MLDPLEPRRLMASVGLDPLYADNGTAALARSLPNETLDGVFAAAATPAGELYALESVTTPASFEGVFYDEYLLRVAADGTPDTAFGDGGRTRVPIGDFARSATQPMAVRLDGSRVAVIADGGDVLQYGRDGEPLTEANTKINALRNNRQLLQPESVTYDEYGQLYVTGRYRLDTSGRPYYAVARYGVEGSLDALFGENGVMRLFKNADEPPAQTNDPIVYRTAVAGGGIVAVITGTENGGVFDDPIYFADRTVTLSLYNGRGRFFKRTIASDSETNDGTPTASIDVADLRAIGRDRFAYAASAGFDTGVGTINGKGVQTTLDTGTSVSRFTTRLDGAGKPVLSPGTLNGGFDPPTRPRATNDLRIGDEFFVLADRALLAVGVAGGNRVAVQRFAAGLPAAEANTTPGTVRVINRGTTLAVRGTDGDDTVVVRRRGEHVHVRINGGPVEVFSLRSFYDVRIDTGDGDDALDVKLAGRARDVYVAGGAGDDRVFTDNVRGELRGEAGDDWIYSGDAGPDASDDRGTTKLGGDGNDTIYGGGFGDGGPGNDLMRATADANFTGGDGNDTVLGLLNGLTLTGGDGDDVAYILATSNEPFGFEQIWRL